MEQCSACRFWLNWDSEMTNLGECHRFPPRMATLPRADGEGTAVGTVRPDDGGWPLTAPEDWCGEFQRPLGKAAPPPPSAEKGLDTGPAI